MIKAVCLDAGYTLVYPHPSVAGVYSRETERFGPRIPAEHFASAFGPIFREFVQVYSTRERTSDELDTEMWRDILRRMHGEIPALSTVTFEPWFRHLHQRFGDPDVWRLFDDTEPTLAELRSRGYKIAIVSNWDRRLRRIAEGLGLLDKIDALVISAETGVRKPHPRIFEHALDALGVLPEEAVHVGDVAEEDVVGARRAGLQAVLLRRNERLMDGGVDGVPVMQSLSELLTWIRTGP